VNWLLELGEQIRTARARAGLTQETLAKSLSVSRGQLSNYENGKCPPNVNVVTEIAEALGADFFVRGFRIGRQMVSEPSRKALPEQLCFEFNVEHRFPAATVTIEPSRDSILITAIVPRRVV
jgi:transcriptional regulator with XRE-family HTH domain